jgi:hypothetical protein
VIWPQGIFNQWRFQKMSKLAQRANRTLPNLKLAKVEGEVKTFSDEDNNATVRFIPGHWEGEALTEKGKEFKVTGANRKEVATLIREKGGFRRRKEELLAALKSGAVTEEQLVKKAKVMNPDFKTEAPAPKKKAAAKKPAAKKKPAPKRKSKEVDDPLL